jgi:hypothetical protein
LLIAIREYLDREVLPHDFMPSPSAFVVNVNDPSEIERKKREYRPAYLALDQQVNAKLADGR